MKKISINNIIKFRNKSHKSKKTFLNSLNKSIIKTTDSGGNYWIRSLSALNNTFKFNDNTILNEKIYNILIDYHKSNRKQTKDMYQKNIDILYNFLDTDFSKWHPLNMKILKKESVESILVLNDIPIQILPSHIFTFENNGQMFIGAIWFVIQLNGYSSSDLGIFAESIYHLLDSNFSSKYIIDPQYCTVVDAIKKVDINYQMIIDNKITPSLNEITKEIYGLIP